jgi:hypothetical protein
VKRGGILVLDDMIPKQWGFPEQKALNKRVRETLHRDPRFITAELRFSSGVFLATHLRE